MNSECLDPVSKLVLASRQILHEYTARVVIFSALVLSFFSSSVKLMSFAARTTAASRPDTSDSSTSRWASEPIDKREGFFRQCYFLPINSLVYKFKFKSMINYYWRTAFPIVHTTIFTIWSQQKWAFRTRTPGCLIKTACWEKVIHKIH